MGLARALIAAASSIVTRLPGVSLVVLGLGVVVFGNQIGFKAKPVSSDEASTIIQQQITNGARAPANQSSLSFPSDSARKTNLPPRYSAASSSPHDVSRSGGGEGPEVFSIDGSPKSRRFHAPSIYVAPFSQSSVSRPSSGARSSSSSELGSSSRSDHSGFVTGGVSGSGINSTGETSTSASSSSATADSSGTTVTSSTGSSAPVSSSLSSVQAFPASVIADNVATISLSISLVDSDGNALSGRTVTATSSRVTDTLVGSPATSNASGIAQISVRSSSVGASTITVVADGVTLSQAKLLFLSATPWTDYQARLWNTLTAGDNSHGLKDSWNDLASSGSSTDGSLLNFTFSPAGSVPWAGSGSALISSSATGPYRLVFDGADDYVDFGTGINASGPISFETWIRPSSVLDKGKVILGNGETINGGTAAESNLGLTLKQSKAYPGRIELQLGQGSYSDVVLADNPDAYWRFGDFSGDVAYDSSGNANQGSFTGTYTLNQTGALPGDPNKSIRFDGATSYMTSTVAIGATVTIEMWAKSTNLAQPMLWITGAVGSGPDLFFYNGKISLNQWNGDANPFCLMPANANDGNFHHFVTVINGGDSTAKLYYDGTLCGSANYVNPTGTFRLSSGHASYLWDGTIDEVAVYSAPLSATAVQNHYYAGLKRMSCTSSSGLVQDVWHHLTGVFDPAGVPSLTLHLNGVPSCSISLAGAAYTGSSNSLKAGRDSSAANSWSGAISDVRSYASALTQSQVSSNLSASTSIFPTSDVLPVLSGLKLWLKADEITGTADGAPLAHWNDSSGLGNHATQTQVAMPDQRPQYSSSAGPNGKALVRFDGTDDFFNLTTALNTEPITMFVVTKMADNGNNRGGWLGNATAFFGFSNDNDRYFAVDGAGAFFPSPAPQVFATVTYLMSTAVGSDDKVYENGILKGNVTGAWGGTVNAVGKLNGRYFWGDIAEMILYDSAISDAQRVQVEAYLNAKYGIY